MRMRIGAAVAMRMRIGAAVALPNFWIGIEGQTAFICKKTKQLR
jgi:hypothetical protein